MIYFWRGGQTQTRSVSQFYKLTIFDRWNINLLPSKHYCWVLSCSSSVYLNQKTEIKWTLYSVLIYVIVIVCWWILSQCLQFLMLLDNKVVQIDGHLWLQFNMYVCYFLDCSAKLKTEHNEHILFYFYLYPRFVLILSLPIDFWVNGVFSFRSVRNCFRTYMFFYFPAVTSILTIEKIPYEVKFSFSACWRFELNSKYNH